MQISLGCEDQQCGSAEPGIRLQERARTVPFTVVSAVSGAALLSVLLSFPSCLQAQTETQPEPQTDPPPASVQTSLPAEPQASPGLLHAYVNLIQIPVLVLDAQRRSAPHEEAGNFTVRIDSGPPFAPRHVRVEGTDALRLTVLVDRSGTTAETLPSIHEGINRLGELLSASDTVATSVLTGCTMRSDQSLAPNPSRMQSALSSEEQGASTNTAANGKPCGAAPRLWDFATVLLDRMDQTPGRRVLLLITDGKDAGSTHTWRELVHAATLHSTTIFAIRPAAPAVFRTGAHEVDPLVALTELTGGMVLNAGWGTHEIPIERFNTLVRSRYILEFPRPAKMGKGMHDLAVTLRNDKKAFVRPAGAGVPLPDPKELNGPDLVPSSTKTPEVGTRHVLTH